MNKQEFNKRCAEFMGIYYSSNVDDVFVVWPDESMPREFDPHSDANDQTKIITKIIQSGYEIELFTDDGYIFIHVKKDGWSRMTHGNELSEIYNFVIEEVLENDK